MKIRILSWFALMICCLTANAYGQINYSNKKEFVEKVLNSHDLGYILCLKIRHPDSIKLKILVAENRVVFYKLCYRYGWEPSPVSYERYTSLLKSYVENDSPFLCDFVISDLYIEDYQTHSPISELPILSLVDIFLNYENKNLKDRYFRYILIALFRKNVICMENETEYFIVPSSP